MDKYQTLREKDNPSNNVFPNIRAQNIPSGAVTSAKIGTGEVYATNLHDDAVTTPKIADGAVTSLKITDGNVTSSKIADGAVTRSKIVNNAVNADKLEDLAVTTSKIESQAVTFTKLKYTRKTAVELLALCPTLHDFYLFIGEFRVRMLSFFSYSLAEMAYPTHYFFDANAEVVYMQEYDDNNGVFIYTKLQTDADYTSFVQDHRLSVQYMG